MRLGIDFGTTRTVVAAVEDGNYPVLSFQTEGGLAEYVPSLVALRHGELLYGWDAAMVMDEPDVRALRSMKRLATEHRAEDRIELGPGCAPTLRELFQGFLRHLAEMIRSHSNVLFEAGGSLEAMIACPANSSSNQRYLTQEAFVDAGFEVLGMLNEPAAAAVEFVHRHLRNLGNRSPKKYVVVYDLGGGTFDTSAVGLAERDYEVIAHEGIARLGGDDFDEAILALVLEQADIAPESLSPAQRTRLLEECRERKEGLKPTTRKIVVDLAEALGDERSVVVETATLYERCRPLIERSLAAIERVLLALAEEDIDPEDGRSLAALYLVGGSIAFPPVARALRDLHGRKVKVSPFPHAAPAIGLAVAADPQAEVRVRESVSRHFGVWREQAEGRDKVFDPIFEKGARLDPSAGILEVRRRYRPVHNLGHLRYLECSALGPAGDPTGDMSFWQRLVVPYDPALYERQDLAELPVEERPELAEREVEERYSYEENGGIRVELRSLDGDFQRVYSLAPRQG